VVRGQPHAPTALYPRERPGSHCTGGWVGRRARLDRCGKSRPPQGFDPRTIQPVASRYTDWATRPTSLFVTYYYYYYYYHTIVYIIITSWSMQTNLQKTVCVPSYHRKTLTTIQRWIFREWRFPGIVQQHYWSFSWGITFLVPWHRT